MTRSIGTAGIRTTVAALAAAGFLTVVGVDAATAVRVDPQPAASGLGTDWQEDWYEDYEEGDVEDEGVEGPAFSAETIIEMLAAWFGLRM